MAVPAATHGYGQLQCMLAPLKTQAAAAAALMAGHSHLRQGQHSTWNNPHPSACRAISGMMDVSRLNDWEIPAEEIAICKRADGEQWRLGSGGALLIESGTWFRA